MLQLLPDMGLEVPSSAPAVLADAVVEVAADRAQGERLARAGRRLVEARYGWDAIGRRLVAVYEELIGGADASMVG